MSWSAPGASQGNGSTQNGQTFSYSNAGTYTLTLSGPGTVTATITVAQGAGGGGGGGGGGGAPTCADVDFKVLDAGSGLQITANQFGVIPVLANESLSFTASATTFTSYDWDFGDGTPHGTGATAPHTYLSGGIYPTVKLTVPANSNSTCKTQASHDLFVSGPAGPTGIFVARYADNSPFLATQVASGKAMSFLATDAGDASTTYTWDFGDGSLPGTGQTLTHTYNESVVTNRTVKLIVTMGSLTGSTQQTFTVLPPPEPPKWFVAGVAYLPGAIAGTLWQTDFTILNPDPTRPGTYSLAFLDGRNPVAPANLVWKTINLGAQQSISSPNVLAFFGQPLGSYGALLVRGDVAPVAPVTTSRTFNNGDPTKGTFGLSVPSTQASSGVSPQASAAQQYLIGLRDDGTAYTNIALVNLVSTDWSHAHLTFFDAMGVNLGLLNVSMPPYGVAQLTRPLTTPPLAGGGLGLPNRDLYSVQVTVDAGGAVFPYATIIDNTSTDPIAVTPTVQPSSAYRVPGIVRAPGANGTVWRSRFFLHNPSSAPRKVNVQYSYVACAATCGGRSSIGQDIPLAAGETKSWDDFPSAWITGPGSTVSDDVTYGDSFIDVSPATGDTNVDPLLVLGETFNVQPTGPVGLELPGFTDLDAGSKTSAGKRLVLAGLESDNAFRTNVAFFLTSGAAGIFQVHVISDTGAELKSFGWNLTGSSPFKQFSDSDLFGGVNKSDRMSIIVDSLDGSPVAAYATIIDNTSGAATFVKAQTGP
jgi:PKD repeat protein